MTHLAPGEELYSGPYSQGAHSSFHIHVKSTEKHKRIIQADSTHCMNKPTKTQSLQKSICSLGAAVLCPLRYILSSRYKDFLTSPRALPVRTSGPLLRLLPSLSTCSPPCPWGSRPEEACPDSVSHQAGLTLPSAFSTALLWESSFVNRRQEVKEVLRAHSGASLSGYQS